MAESMEFKTEVSRLLDIVIYSLYSNKDIFLRELISNSSDAIDKIRYEAITDPSKYENDSDLKIKISADKDKKTLTISDNGIGMAYDEVINTLGTIAASGTKEFMKIMEEQKQADATQLIGQFGVGFYSAFMVASKVEVITRKALSTDAVIWSSMADGNFTIDTSTRSSRGTDVILYLRDENIKYLDEWTIRELVTKYSDYIEYPVVMDIERKKNDDEGKPTDEIEVKEEILNSQKAIWLKDKSSITDDEYNEFYKHITHDYSPPLTKVHFKAEGNYEFSALLYIPERKPFDIVYKEYKSGPMLYVKRVQIMDHCEDLIPPYLRFIKGVVESDDLPLNISREILQSNKQIEIIKKNITKRILDELKNLKNNEYKTKYLTFYTNFSRVLKEGLHYDIEKREQIADLLLFSSTKSEKDALVTLDDYIMRMKTEQEDIYYMISKNIDEALSSPYIEGLREKDIEVLIMTDDIDDIVISAMKEYKGKKFRSVVKGDMGLDDNKEKEEKNLKEYSALIDFIKDKLKNYVADVKLSSRLKDSAVCLITGDQDIDPYLEQMMNAMGNAIPKSKRVMEINPDHNIFIEMKTVFEKEPTSDILAEYSLLLYDQALILEGDKPLDATKFTKSIAKLMSANLGKN